MALKAWSVASTPLMSLVDGSSDLWTESAADGCGFFYNGEDISDVPISVLINDEHAMEGELGSLSPGEFAFGRAEADELSQDTVYYMPEWTSLSDGETDLWTESGSGTGEYYYTGDDLTVEPWKVEINGVEAEEGTLGSLNPGEYAWGKNDAFSEDNALYVRPHLDSLSDGETDLWTESGSGTGEYYYTGDDLDGEPDLVLLDGSKATKGTLGSLSAVEYGWGDNDDIGEDTLYVRLSDDEDPDSKSADYVESSYEPDNQEADYVRSAIDPDDLEEDAIECSQYTEILQAGSDIECILLSILVANYGQDDAVIELVITDSSDTVKFKWWLELAATDSPWGMDSKLVIDPEGKLKVNSSRENVNIYVSGDES